MASLRPAPLPIKQFKLCTSDPDIHAPMVIRWSTNHGGYVGECWCGLAIRIRERSIVQVLSDLQIHSDARDANNA